MKHVNLLGVELKSDFFFGLFETYETEVVYEYDRSYENLRDEYRGEIPELGMQFVFDEFQKLKTIFIRNKPISTWNPFEGYEELFAEFGSKEEAKKHAALHGIPITEGCAVLFGEEQDWVRFDLPRHSIHYEFVGGKLQMVTLSRSDA